MNIISYEGYLICGGWVLRKIVQIDEEKCDGCGVCIPNCAEGALQIIDGKARLVKDSYCDGLGACLGHCPKDAIKIIEREADEFDEEAVERYLSSIKPERLNTEVKSTLNQWPIQLNLVPIKAQFFENSDLLMLADCTAVAIPDLHDKLLKGKTVIMGCPKFDDARNYAKKLTEILKQNTVRSLTVAHMEVPCCSGLEGIAEFALKESGKMVPSQSLLIRIDGTIERK
jgi:ferredoxin